jgi:hypothetical protein
MWTFYSSRLLVSHGSNVITEMTATVNCPQNLNSHQKACDFNPGWNLQNFPVSKLLFIAKAQCLVRAGIGRAGFRFTTQSKTSVLTLLSRCFKIKCADI